MSSTISTTKLSKRRPPAPRPARSIIRPMLHYILLIFLALIFLIPFYLIIRNSLATENEIRLGVLFPSTLHFENIQELFNDDSTSMLSGLLNSTLVAVLGTIGQIFISALAGYALARIPSRWSNSVFFAVLGTMMIPGAITFLPTYIVVSYIGWIGTLQGLIIPGLFSGFQTFMFRQFFLSFPRELEEAGLVDGLGYWGIYWRIVVPNSLPIFAALGITGLIVNWNSFLWPLVNAQTGTSQTVQVVISTFMTSQTIVLHEVFMAAAIAILPLVLLFLFFQRYIVQGYTQSGLKG
jgi:multiple sugar transport system permease protein